jgi:hypothetical protein
MDMAEAGVGSGAAGQQAGKLIHVSFMAASTQWELNGNGKRLKNETSVPISAPADWGSGMEWTEWELAREVAQLH